MSYGAMASFADVIERETLVKVVGEDLVKAVEEHVFPAICGEAWSDEQISDCVDEHYGGKSAAEAIHDYEKLCLAFEELTCLKLQLHHHDSDNGSPHDEESGFFWAVEGTRDWSPAGWCFLHTYGMDAFERKFWSIYG